MWIRSPYCFSPLYCNSALKNATNIHHFLGNILMTNLYFWKSQTPNVSPYCVVALFAKDGSILFLAFNATNVKVQPSNCPSITNSSEHNFIWNVHLWHMRINAPLCRALMSKKLKNGYLLSSFRIALIWHPLWHLHYTLEWFSMYNKQFWIYIQWPI